MFGNDDSYNQILSALGADPDYEFTPVPPVTIPQVIHRHQIQGREELANFVESAMGTREVHQFLQSTEARLSMMQASLTERYPHLAPHILKVRSENTAAHSQGFLQNL